MGPCLTEEKLIDLLLSKLPAHQEEQAKQHLVHCAYCQARAKEWQQLVRDASADRLSWRYTAPKLKKRLKEKILPSGHDKVLVGKPAIMLLSVSLLLCFTLLAGLWPLTETPFKEETMNEATLPPVRSVQAVTPDTRFLINPQTVHYRIQHTITMPIDDAIPPVHQVHGHLWVAPRGQQIFMMLEGLQPLPENDYQVWVITREMASSAGLFNLFDSNAVLYWRNDQPADIEMIRISIEPKGGSFSPSGPEALLIPLRH